MSDGLIPRALADVYPYDPKYRDRRTHPSINRTTVEKGRQFSYWLDMSDPKQAQTAIRRIKKDAARMLSAHAVRHFEVVWDNENLGWYAVVDKHVA